MNEKMKATKELQQMLRDIAKTDSDIVSLIPDGIFGEETEDSVKSFQRKKGFDDTGVVDYELWSVISDEHRKALFLLSNPIRLTDIKNEDFPLKEGDKNSKVEFLNVMLNHLSSKHKNFLPVTPGDYFSSETTAQVKNWQKVISTPVTGEVDKFSWNTLSEFYTLG